MFKLCLSVSCWTWMGSTLALIARKGRRWSIRRRKSSFKRTPCLVTGSDSVLCVLLDLDGFAPGPPGQEEVQDAGLGHHVHGAGGQEVPAPPVTLLQQFMNDLSE